MLRKRLKTTKGSLTVEASIALPLFILAIYSLLYIMQLVMIHNTMQSALTGVAYETGQYVTAYTKTGIDEEAEFAFMMVYRLISNLDQEENGQEELFQYEKPLTSFFVSVLEQKVQNGVANVFFRNMIQKYLSANENGGNTLLAGRVIGGIEGLDFSGSQILTDKRTIKLVLNYKIQPVFKLGNITQFSMQNVALILPWQEGHNAYTEVESFSAWADFEPIQRGTYIMEREIAQILHENMDKNTIVFNGKAFKAGVLCEQGDVFEEIVNIRSIDYSMASYQNGSTFMEAVMNEIDEVSLVGRYVDIQNGKIIRTDNNTKRTMLLVLPEGNANLSTILNRCHEYANEQGVRFIVKYAYGKPKYDIGQFKNDTEEKINEKPIHENNTDLEH